MSASQFVGRVGGLAVALGVGAAVFSSGSGVASADRGGHDSGASGDSSSSAHRAPRGAAAGAASTTSTRRNSRPAPAAVRAASKVAAVQTSSAADDSGISVPAAASVAAPKVSAPAPAAAEPEVQPEAQTYSDPVADEPVEVADPVVAEPDQMDVIYMASGTASDGAGSGGDGQVDSPLAAAFLAYANRRSTGATHAPRALVTSSANGIFVDPTVYYYDGILQGNLQATSDQGLDLTYKFEGSSDGGKLKLGDVPAPLPGSGAQSYTLLPYATWKTGAPNPQAQPTGIQTWNVRVSEVTDFDKLLAKIPVVGLIAQPIIEFLQKSPLLSNLLAPIIGGSTVAEIEANLDTLVAAGKPVAYTIMVDSWDGTPISTNFFPAVATSLFPGNYEATVFNGPGLGSPGETNPYGTNQAAGSAPGLGILRGGLQAGSGFNTITWDPRGEGESGGILQLDNPFYEGRDVSALIDWAVANTPALAAGGDPLIGMAGGSYGGGIQMTTVDPRIDAVVPAIAWSSLTESLYPDKVFKASWANALSLALLKAGARSNNQIAIGILTGNLFGKITETGQATLTSSGPTSLLTKLSIPTMYVQGTVDALFPLAQAVENAQTQLEQNPYFAGANADQVKMIWFCGGHGTCLDPVDVAAQGQAIFEQNMIWLNYYVKGAPLPAPIDLIVPTFQWWDQAGNHLVSALMPFSNGFVTGAVTGTDADGGTLRIRPRPVGGSGPETTDCTGSAGQAGCEFPLNQAIATEATNALNVDITIPNAGTQVVGAPTVTFTYTGRGRAEKVFGQIVDQATGRVLGNINAPIPLVLDGDSHTTTVSLSEIAYTSPSANSTLTLQIVPGTSLYKNGQRGSVDISNILVSLPTTTTGTIV